MTCGNTSVYPADLVRASGLKPNGRPVIDAPRVSAWLKGERPSFDLASTAGDALGIGAAAALAAAGYTSERSGSGDPVGGGQQDGGRGPVLTVISGLEPKVEPDLTRGDEEDNEVLAAIRRDPSLSPRNKAHYLNQYMLLRDLSALESASAVDPAVRLPYVAHGKQETPVDPEQEQQLEEIARETRRRTGAGQEGPDGDHDRNLPRR